VIGYVLVVTICSWGCGESSHYEPYSTLAACQSAGELISNPMTERGHGVWSGVSFECSAGNTFGNGLRWSSTGIDWAVCSKTFSDWCPKPPDAFKDVRNMQ